MGLETPKKRLVLHVEVPGLYCDNLPESARIWAEPDEPTPQDYLNVVLEKWFRADVGLTVVTQPGEKCMNDDFQVAACNGRIVGVEVLDREGG